MRATISFDLELGKVESTMATLVSQEAGTVRVITNILDNVGEGPLLPAVNEAIDLLQEVTNQLHQYQQMLAGFEKAKFETMLPQSVDSAVATIGRAPADSGTIVDSQRSLQSVLESMSAFDGSVDKMSEREETDDDPEEG